MSNSNRVTLKGSERAPLTGAHAVGAVDPQELIEVSLFLKRRAPLPTAETRVKHLTHAEFAAQHGADPADLELVRQFGKENNLQLLERGDEIQRRSVILAGTAAAM